MRWVWVGFAIVIIGAFVVRALTAPDFIETRDGLFFTRGVVRYSVPQMRPHWPGYPIYIWLGRLFALVAPNPIVAMHLLSVAASALTVIPIALLAYSWRRECRGTEHESQIAGGVAAIVWLFVPMSWLNGTEIFSDPLALLLGLTILWLCWRTDVTHSRSIYAAAGLAGLMLGVRLSYVALLCPLAYCLWRDWRATRSVGRTVRLTFGVGLAFLAPIALWLGWQVAQDGLDFFTAGTHHLDGHYSEWGGSAATDHNTLTRPVRFAETTLVYGFGGWWLGTPLVRLPATLLLFVAGGLGGWRLWHGTTRKGLIVGLLWAVPYGLWIMLGNDVGLARYGAPLVALGCVIAGVGLPRTRVVGIGAALSFALALGFVTIPLVFEHHSNPPMALKIATFAATSLDPQTSTLIVSDDATSLVFLIQENAPNIRSLRVLWPDVPAYVAQLEAHGRTVYLVALPNRHDSGWSPVARMCRGQFMESRGPQEFWLYQHGVPPTDPPPDCTLTS